MVEPESDRRHRHDAAINTLGLKNFGSADEQSNVGAVSNEDCIGICAIDHGVSSARHLQSIAEAVARSRRKVGAVLSRQDEGSWGFAVFHRHFPGNRCFGAVGGTKHEYAVFAGMVFQLFHQAELSLLLNGFVSRTVFAHAERVVSPHVFYRELHERSHTESGFHIVGEYEECTASAVHTAVKRDAVHNCSHRELGNSGLQECAVECVRSNEAAAFFEESVGFVAVSQVCRRNEHIIHHSAEFGENVSRRLSSGDAGFMLDCAIVYFGEATCDAVVQFFCFFGIFGSPFVEFRLAVGNDGFEFGASCFVESGSFGEYFPGVVGVAAEVFDGFFVACAGFAQRVAVCAATRLEVFAVGGYAAFTHCGVADDDSRAFGFGVGVVESLHDLLCVGAVNFDDVPIPSAIFCSRVFVRCLVDHRSELHAVAVVEHDEVAQPQQTGNTSGTLRNFLLDTAVGDECVSLMRNNVAKASHEEAFGNCRADSHNVTLTERAGSVFDAAFDVNFGVTGSHRAPLAEAFEVVDGIFAAEEQCCIEHCRHMTGVEEEAVASEPMRVLGVEYKIF